MTGNLLIDAIFTPYITLSREIGTIYLKFLMPNILENIPNQSKFQSNSHVNLFIHQTLNTEKNQPNSYSQTITRGLSVHLRR